MARDSEGDTWRGKNDKYAHRNVRDADGKVRPRDIRGGNTGCLVFIAVMLLAGVYTVLLPWRFWR